MLNIGDPRYIDYFGSSNIKLKILTFSLRILNGEIRKDPLTVDFVVMNGKLLSLTQIFKPNRAVIVVQLAERSLLIPEVRRSDPIFGAIL